MMSSGMNSIYSMQGSWGTASGDLCSTHQHSGGWVLPKTNWKFNFLCQQDIDIFLVNFLVGNDKLMPSYYVNTCTVVSLVRAHGRLNTLEIWPAWTLGYTDPLKFGTRVPTTEWVLAWDTTTMLGWCTCTNVKQNLTKSIVLVHCSRLGSVSYTVDFAFNHRCWKSKKLLTTSITGTNHTLQVHRNWKCHFSWGHTYTTSIHVHRNLQFSTLTDSLWFSLYV